MRRLVQFLFLALAIFLGLVTAETLGWWNRGPLVITREGEAEARSAPPIRRCG